jgi:hypothetical protein
MLAEARETFWTLLRDPAHWEFEIFLMVVFDGLLGALLFPAVRRWIRQIRRQAVEEEHEKHGITESHANAG